MTERLRIVIVDEGQTFGGSLVVAAQILRHIDPDLFDITLVSELDADELGHLVDPVLVRTVRHKIGYLTTLRLRQKIGELPSNFLRKLLLYALSGIVGIANFGYRAKLQAALLTADIVHSNNSREAVFIGASKGIPVLRHCHGVLPVTPGLLDRREDKMVTLYVAASNYIASTATGLDVSADRIEVIENPCELPTEALTSEAASFRRQLDIPPSARVFAVVGRIIEWKGQKEFLRAALQVLESMPDAYALVVGHATEAGESYNKELLALVRASGIAERVRFVPYTTDISVVYTAIDLLVHTSIEPEPFGLVITEAMAHKVPVIAANSGGPLDIIEHNRNGILADPRATDELATAIAKVLTDGEWRQQLVDNAFADVASRYSPQKFAESFSAAYRRLASKD